MSAQHIDNLARSTERTQSTDNGNTASGGVRNEKSGGERITDGSGHQDRTALTSRNERSSTASRSRDWQVAAARDLLLDVRSPETVVVVGRDVGRPEESVVVTTLGALDPSSVDMKSLLIVGSSATRVTAAGHVWTPRSTE